jgi:unsaturated rhamnogalacturonyl hydrolase
MMRTVCSLSLLCLTAAAGAQTLPAQAARDADAMVRTAKAVGPSLQWTYEAGTLLDGVAAHWQITHNPDDLAFIRATVDRWADPNGNITMKNGKPFDPSAHTLDDLEPGRICLFLYTQTHDDRFRKAAGTVWAQFATQPRTREGGFWHKQIYPQQMWLDGAYMAEPFRAAYAVRFGHKDELADVAKQMLLMYDNMRDPKTGLLRHGWDSSKQMPWADKQTGLSPESWARAMGWYMVAMADVLPYFSKSDANYAKLHAAFAQLANAIAQQQDKSTGLSYDVLGHPGEAGNFFESSASAMFVYAIAKGVRTGNLPHSLLPVATRGFAGIEKKFVTREPNGLLTLHGTVKVSGLGGKPYRAGNYAYYVHETVGDNDFKGMGAYLLAASEIEQLSAKPRGAARGTAATTP